MEKKIKIELKPWEYLWRCPNCDYENFVLHQEVYQDREYENQKCVGCKKEFEMFSY